MITFTLSSVQVSLALVLIVLTAVVGRFLWSYGQRGLVSKVQSAEVELEDTTETVASLRLRLGKAIEARDEVYMERNMLLCLLLRIVQTERLEGWDIKRGYTAEFIGWEDVVYVQASAKYGLPQMSWHFKADQGWMLGSLGLPDGGKWDGTTTEQKYAAIKELLKSGALAGRISAAAPAEGYPMDGNEPIAPAGSGQQ